MSEYNPSPLVRSEMNRILGLIPETDPRSREYALVLESLERLLAISGTIDEIVREYPPQVDAPSVIDFNPPVKEEEKFEVNVSEPEPTPEPVVEREEVVYDIATVKQALQDARMAGKFTSAKEWIKKEFNADGFMAIPASRYGEVMAKLKELG